MALDHDAVGFLEALSEGFSCSVVRWMRYSGASDWVTAYGGHCKSWAFWRWNELVVSGIFVGM